jgi:Acetyltransferase (GNAT) domain
MGVVIERRGGHHWLNALPYLLPAAPLARPDTHARVDSACARALDSLALERRAVGGTWVCYRPAGPPVAEEVLVRLPGATTQVETAVVDLRDGRTAVHARIPRTLRQHLNRVGDGVTFSEEPEALEAVHVLHQRQSRGWTGHAALPIELSRRLLAVGRSGSPRARLFVLRERGRLLAGTLFLDHPRELLAWWSGIHPDARRRHLFQVLLWRAIEWAVTAGRERLNLGGSAGRGSLVSFKQALGAEDLRLPVRWIGADYSPWTGKLLARFQSRLRAGRSRGVVA